MAAFFTDLIHSHHLIVAWLAIDTTKHIFGNIYLPSVNSAMENRIYPQIQQTELITFSILPGQVQDGVQARDIAYSSNKRKHVDEFWLNSRMH
jgi:hypothetical protein